MNSLKYDRILFGVIVGTAVIARLVFLSSRDTVVDDAYITFRYAENLLHGKVFVYNPGEVVYGASSPLYTFLSAAVLFICSKDLLPTIFALLGTLSLVGFVGLLWKALPMSLTARAIMAIGLLSYPRIFYTSLNGMEECFILFLMGASVVACNGRHPIWLGLICTFLFMTKIDTLAWIAAILLVGWLSQKSFPWKSIAAAGLFSVPWVLVSYHLFGSIIPHTIEAKRIAYAHDGGWNLVNAVLFMVPDAFVGNPTIVAIYGVAVYGTLGIALARVIRRSEFVFLAFPLYCLGYTVLLIASGTSLGLWERWTVPHWGMFLVTFSYLFHPPGSIDLHASPERLKRPVFIFLLCLQLGGLSAAFLYPVKLNSERGATIQVGEWLRTHATPNQSVMLEPIGLIGYVTNLYIHDFFGLVTPEVTEARKSSALSNRWYCRYVRKYLPEFLVLRVREVEKNEFLYGGYGDGIFLTEEASWFHERYRQVYRATGGDPNQELLVFRINQQPQAAKVLR